MSVENAERLLRFMKQDPELRKKVDDAGPQRFETVAAEAGASCTAYDFVRAINRTLEQSR